MMRAQGFASLALLVASSAAACSSSSGAVACGSGTTRVGNQCVAIEDGGSSDSMVMPDVSMQDASPADVTQQEGSVGEASAKDASPDGTADSGATCSPSGDGDAGTSPDPCLVNSTASDFICDSSCSVNWTDAANSDQTMCAAATCSAGGTIMAGQTLGSTDRTPNAPGTDPKCATDCPTNPWAYGLSVTMAGGGVGSGPYTVTVAPPWYLVGGTSTPFCPTSTSPAAKNCLSFDGSKNELFYVVTCDPNAPARNIVVQATSSCP